MINVLDSTVMKKEKEIREYSLRLVSSLMRPVEGFAKLPSVKVGPHAKQFMLECLCSTEHSNYGFNKPMFRLRKAGRMGYKVELIKNAKPDAIQTRKGWVASDLATPLAEACIEFLSMQAKHGGRKPGSSNKKSQAVHSMPIFTWVCSSTNPLYTW